ncbi:hypothetical protein AN7433.2 [Aspergillus nidulans FGSC A4]|uniref:Uncharacterized protein n=1 Tax=Emericella nidulans (strain FGSC A4 / ATCC 38163 / CBS 112.46 / NRRL 194 / M139) TaxID=227321 RepID=Q5AW97_EMENI|nr:hypothetical protein [Aspergillus nidulans FGSC A4]EAA62013.1 hypothetical protein AN7433.2 [Aspergillus nidulans FGSC A4]CBF79373.1 TPA: conserved hypothetical protein [Aspergillus nidulans FGSC A4]|eukprot:XP_680702.1 hypothetical protein AN7433.2 [Aspergillus nidulans FGSC A4]
MENTCDSPGLSSTSANTEVELQSESSDGTQGHGHPLPEHPIQQLQGAFIESIHEALHGETKDWVVDLDAQSRRRELLENAEYERLCGRKWRQRTDERYHPFWKLIAQMSFGLHLLVQGTAKSNAAVVNILQVHVDEMDGFISRTREDFLIIQLDLRTRIQYLSLPLESLDHFDEMLADRSFRFAMIDYNAKIELAIERFTLAIGDSLRDLQKGREAVGALWQYLGQSAKDNAPLSGSLTTIYNSMLANTEGWNSAFCRLRRTGHALQYAITQLGRAVTELQRRVGVASRREAASFVQPHRPISRATSFKGIFERVSVHQKTSSLVEKPLPCDPTLAKRSYSRPHTSVCGSGILTHQKSVPNLRVTPDPGNRGVKDQVPGRAKSVNGALPEGSDTGSVLPKFSKTISRRFPKAKLVTKADVEVAEDMPTRPSTGVSSTLKSFRKSRHGHCQQLKQQEPTREALPPDRSKKPNTSNTMTKREAMREQLLQFFKSDRVLEAWEGVKESEKKIGQPLFKKDGLWSRFQARSPSAHSEDFATDPLDAQMQLEWLDEETKNLNTYSLKPRSGPGPRFHTISEHLGFYQQTSYKEKLQHDNADSSVVFEDDESIITALPAFPLPPVGHRLPEPYESPLNGTTVKKPVAQG